MFSIWRIVRARCRVYKLTITLKMLACGANINISASAGLYYIEYTLKNLGESQRHLFSVLGIANNGVYNRLYTLTGQVRLAKTFSILYMEIASGKLFIK